ncbi:metallophosphoesterase [Myxococcota bacterium]|nr:metallophosphoesterase [Myxococcota bacterium]MBU1381627.1 metallophosphoesterase [Myxococcota bacterium]MBU1496829.1 metallophosphoesterase [Myxococcota bacterium]
MRLACISDLHFDHNIGLLPVLEDRVKKLRPDVLVLGGDLFNGSSRLGAILKRIKDIVPRLLFVPGNHDLWLTETAGTLNSSVLYTEVLRGIALRSGVDYLGNMPVIIGNTAFVGITGWYDAFPSGDKHSPDEKLCIFPGLDTPIDVVSWQCELLKKQFKEVPETIERIVVVCHTVPFLSLVKDMVPDDILSYQGSDRLGETILSEKRVRHIFSGHLHRCFFHADVGNGVNWESVACGYSREWDKPMDEHISETLRLIELH